jgi:tRNA(Ile)-lysidine synthase
MINGMSSDPLNTSYCDDPDALSLTVTRHLCRHRLLRRVSRLGLAVSGGADSVALLHLLTPLCLKNKIALTVLHLNHGLREESGYEESFVRALAAAKGLDCLTEQVRLAEREADGNSLEMAARAARQAFFSRCCGRAGLDAVATGHQADDIAETLLLRLARGAGCTGLAAMRPRSTAAPPLIRAAGKTFCFIRPLLPVSSHALREWLRQRGLTWCEDASNQSCEIPRNRVRNRVLPQLEAEWGASLRARLCRTADILRNEDELLEHLAARRLKAVCPADAIDLPRFQRTQEALRRRVLRQWLFAQGVDGASGFENIARLIDFCRAPDGSKLQVASGTLAVINKNQLLLRSREVPPFEEAPVPLRGRVIVGDLEIVTEPCLGICSEARGIGSYPAVCTIDMAALGTRPLTVRSRQPGDRLFPTGMTGSKKLQDIFVDAKIPESQRNAIPLFTCGNEVVWVPGYRVSRPFGVPSKDAPSLRITVRPLSHAADVPTSTARPGSSGL